MRDSTAGDYPNGLTTEVLRRAHVGDRAALAALREVGHWLGVGVGNLVNVFNPDLIVFGGFYSSIYSFLEPWVLEAAEAAALSVAWDACTIGRSDLGSDARLIGASELVFADVIADPASVGTI